MKLETTATCTQLCIPNRLPKVVTNGGQLLKIQRTMVKLAAKGLFVMSDDYSSMKTRWIMVRNDSHVMVALHAGHGGRRW